ncbi:MAG: hypothetical protein ACSLEM_01535 [Candidatus Malihini olakiniferum]
MQILGGMLPRSFAALMSNRNRKTVLNSVLAAGEFTTRWRIEHQLAQWTTQFDLNCFLIDRRCKASLFPSPHCLAHFPVGVAPFDMQIVQEANSLH